MKTLKVVKEKNVSTCPYCGKDTSFNGSSDAFGDLTIHTCAHCKGVYVSHTSDNDVAVVDQKNVCTCPYCGKDTSFNGSSDAFGDLTIHTCAHCKGVYVSYVSKEKE